MHKFPLYAICSKPDAGTTSFKKHDSEGSLENINNKSKWAILKLCACVSATGFRNKPEAIPLPFFPISLASHFFFLSS
jgi:hypothetical protein